MAFNEESRSTLSDSMASSGSVGGLIDAGQVVMATDRSGRRTMPTSELRDLRSGYRDCDTEAGMESWTVYPLRTAPWRGDAVERGRKGAEEWWKDR